MSAHYIVIIVVPRNRRNAACTKIGVARQESLDAFYIAIIVAPPN